MVARPSHPTDDDDAPFDDDLDPDRYEGIHFVTVEEGRVLFDQAARHDLGISGDEFLRRWDNGEYQAIPDTPEGRKIMGMVMLLPFVRPTNF
ncbi:MAG: hypothetical protein IT338_05400 [Thermomicrobiales bacterium]|nr:hypothetical protein [Thermomicrobiales bacterium]